MIFLSIVSTITGIEDQGGLKFLVRKTISYTLLTTFIAALISFFLYILIEPVTVNSQELLQNTHAMTKLNTTEGHLLNFLLKIVPENIFEPFYSTKVKGTGLGLSITYGIVKGWNGDIYVKSKANKGTNVIIKLPLNNLQA